MHTGAYAGRINGGRGLTICEKWEDESQPVNSFYSIFAKKRMIWTLLFFEIKLGLQSLAALPPAYSTEWAEYIEN